MKRIRHMILTAVASGTFVIGFWAQPMIAQTGDNAVYNPLGSQSPSTAFYDASAIASTSKDICQVLFAAISAEPAGTVIDARGINATNSKPDGTDLKCATGSPWVQGSTSTTKAATILLPAATIQISKQWILPNQTKLIGEGSAGSSSGRTILAACTTASACGAVFTSNFALLKMGSSTVCQTAGCTGVSIEDLSLNGNGITGIIGITNEASHELSYVRNVSMYDILGTGLLVTNAASPAASNSGPYSGLTIAMNTSSTTSACVSLVGNTTNTRGVQGVTCTNSLSATNGVLVNSLNNTLSDIQVSGFTNGITLGNTLPVQSVALLNIKGGSGVTNVLHISSSNTVIDVVALGIVKNGATNAIQDQETLRSGHQTINDASVALYAIGEKITAPIAYSRFTTSPNSGTASPNLPTWSVGTAAPHPTTCTSNGSLYSNTMGAPGSTWYACVNLQWANIK